MIAHVTSSGDFIGTSLHGNCTYKTTKHYTVLISLFTNDHLNKAHGPRVFGEYNIMYIAVITTAYEHVILKVNVNLFIIVHFRFRKDRDLGKYNSYVSYI